MPHFYFHIRDGEEWVEDYEGQELPSLDEARAQAVESARELMAAKVASGKRLNHDRFEIADASGRVVLTMAFEEAIK